MVLLSPADLWARLSALLFSPHMKGCTRTTQPQNILGLEVFSNPITEKVESTLRNVRTKRVK
jgi:hypothetical protein